GLRGVGGRQRAFRARALPQRAAQGAGAASHGRVPAPRGSGAGPAMRFRTSAANRFRNQSGTSPMSPSETNSRRQARVFISYSHRGKGPEWKAKLLRALHVFERHHVLDVWQDGKIRVSAPWNDDIAQAMSSAS